MTSPVQKSFENFKNLKFNPFESKDFLLDDSNNPDKNFYNNIKAVHRQYHFPSELLSLSEKLHISSEKFSMIHPIILLEKISYVFKNLQFVKTTLQQASINHTTELLIANYVISE